jgi:xylitol oxidase
MPREHNWADNYTLKAKRIHRPTTVEEVRRLVAGAARIRAIGARHSFNGVADSPGELIDLSGIDPQIAIDHAAHTVTVGAAANYGTLASILQTQGWALHNTASLPHISIAGAIATGTHGSGDANGNLATAVAGLELVTATGDLMHVRRSDAEFDGMVVGLGAFGVVTRVTLDIQPTFDARQDEFVALPWMAVLTNLDAVMSAAYSVSLMTSWSGDTVNRMWLKTRLVDGEPRHVTAAHLGAIAAAASADDTNLNPFSAPGPWSERLPHFRVGAQPGTAGHLQSEYMMPRARAAEAIAMLRRIGNRIDNHLLTTEIRSMAGDRLWLSPSYGHDSIAIHFSWKREPDAVHGLTTDIEDMLLPLGARPHWGKIMHARAERLTEVYPRLPAFRGLAHLHDPNGKFRNAFMDAHVFG